MSVDWIAQAYDRHAPGLYRYALMLLGDQAAAADVVQQVFVSLVRQPRDLDVDKPERYLRRAVRNESFSVARRRRSRPAFEPMLLEPADPASDDPEQRAIVTQALGALPFEQRETVHLKVFEGMTFQEIADFSGESIDTVASRFRYAMDKLRTILGVRS